MKKRDVLRSENPKKEVIIVKAGQDCEFCGAEYGHKHQIRPEDGYINVHAEPLSGKKTYSKSPTKFLERRVAKAIEKLRRDVEKIAEQYIFRIGDD